MPCFDTVPPHRAGAGGPRSIRRRVGRWLLLLAGLIVSLVVWRQAAAQTALGAAGGPSEPSAQIVQLPTLDLRRSDDGVLLDFTARFDLPKPVEEALLKGVPLYFVAEAELFRSRWYWRDKAIAHVTRSWRLAWQPLARNYRVSLGGLHQTFETLPDALAAVRSAIRWKLADPGQADDDTHHYVEFSYRLDTSQLPRPLQIGLAGQPEWSIAVERTVRLD